MSNPPLLSQKTSSYDDVIAAIATPLGEGGLGVLRLSGAGAIDVGEKVFRSKIKLSDASSHSVVYGRVASGDEMVDECLATVFRAPRSYTGEDVVEFSCHGGPALLRRVLALCLAAGARPAWPGEFTRRAFINGKMDLAQAEAVAHLISAQSETLRRLSLDQLEGRLSRHLQPLRERVLALLARAEAHLDFVDDEVPALPGDVFIAELADLSQSLEKILGTAPQGRLWREGLRVALVGKPNVGKSSLFNSLLRAERAIVTDAPGTTRDTLEERLLIDEVPVVLTDTAGLREAADPVEAQGMARTRRAADQAQVVLWVVDASQPLSEEDKAAAQSLDGRPAVVALNKMDLLKSAPPRAVIPGRWPTILTSAVTGQGLDELRRALVGRVEGFQSVAREAAPAPTVIDARHEDLLRQALSALQAARASVEKGEGEECSAVALRQALAALNEITGQGVTDEVLDAIFSKFCIGK